jgi:hypothetical protein
MTRVMADCRRFPSDNDCSLTIIGEEDEVVRAAVAHAVEAHGHADGEETRAAVRSMLEPAAAYAAERTPEGAAS